MLTFFSPRRRFAVLLWILAGSLLGSVVALAYQQRPVQAPRPSAENRRIDSFKAAFGDLASFKSRLAKCPEVISKDMGHGSRPLHLAAESNREHAIRLLVAHGANINARDGGGYTPLHYAAAMGALKAVKALERSGADISARTGVTTPAKQTRHGATPLAIAALQGNSEAVEFLLSQGAPILYGQDKWSKPYYKYSALHWAVMGSTNWSQPREAAARLRTIDVLADELGDINTMVTGFGLGMKPAFVVAADHGQYRIMKHLMENYPELDVNAGAIENRSALDLVTQQSSDEDSCDCGKLRLKVLGMLQKRGGQ